MFDLYEKMRELEARIKSLEDFAFGRAVTSEATMTIYPMGEDERREMVERLTT